MRLPKNPEQFVKGLSLPEADFAKFINCYITKRYKILSTRSNSAYTDRIIRLVDGSVFTVSVYWEWEARAGLPPFFRKQVLVLGATYDLYGVKINNEQSIA